MMKCCRRRAYSFDIWSRLTSSLIDTHHTFLEKVKDHGVSEMGGKIILNTLPGSDVWDVKIENVKKRNAISGTMMNDLARIVDRVEKDHPTFLILRGSAGFFCSGADFSLAKTLLSTSEDGLAMSRFMTDALNRLRNSDTISVAVVNGPALGGGSEMITACDFRIFHPDAFSQFVHAKIGASPGWGGGHRLYSIVGRQHCLRLLASSCVVGAKEALHIGLADALLAPPPDSIGSPKINPGHHEKGNNKDEVGEEDNENEDKWMVGQGMMFLTPLLAQPFPEAVSAMKRVVVAADSQSLEEARLTEQSVFGSRWMGRDNASVFKSK